MRNKILPAVGIITLTVFTALALGQVNRLENIKKLDTIKLQNTRNELQLEEVKVRQLQDRLNDGQVKSEQEIQDLEKEIEQRKQNELRLERELQAKLRRKEAERVAAAETRRSLTRRVTGTATVSAEPTPVRRAAVSYGGNKDTWLRASGIPQSQWWAVDSIVSRESGWNPNAVNPSSGACGLGQQLPCGKWAGAWNDPVAALKAQYGYVVARYGGYPQAVSFWNANHWY